MLIFSTETIQKHSSSAEFSRCLKSSRRVVFTIEATKKNLTRKASKYLACMDTAQWAQEIGAMSSTTTRPQAPPPPTTTPSAAQSSSSHQQQQQLVERRARPVKEQALPCPRCSSTNTKFCYYNNYSLTQPRYFCKTCRRYWTDGGSLRNVPVGGGSRKNKRHSSSTTTSTTTKVVNPNLQAPASIKSSSSLPIAKPYQGQDLNVAFPDGIIGGLNFPGRNGGGGLSAMELLRSTGITPRGLGPLGMPMSMPEMSAVLYGGAGFGLHDFKLPLDGNGNGHGMQEGGGVGGGGRLLFPFGDLKQASHVKSSNEIGDQENRVQGEQAIFWGGASLGGNGGSW